MKNIKLVATDLDGTFLKNDRSISPENLEMLNRLGEMDIIRVAATGRNLLKVKEVLSREVNFDYVVFSSGAGVYNWKEEKHIYQQNIKKESVKKLLNYFIRHDINFHGFYPVPDNHKHYFFRGKDKCEEFERYFLFNRAHAEALQATNLPQSELCQFLVIIRENEEQFLQLKTEIENLCPEIRVIRASSPISSGYIWIEVFHKSVSKGNGVNEICKLNGINREDTMGLGNDYNDFDLLAFTHYSFLTANSPEEIKKKYPLLPSNENNAFAKSVQPLFD